jgi:YesN/AraC family two-component response regulator
MAIMEISRNKTGTIGNEQNHILSLSVINVVDELFFKRRNGEIISCSEDIFLLFFSLGSSAENDPLDEAKGIIYSIRTSLGEYLGVCCRFVLMTKNICPDNLREGFARLKDLYNPAFFAQTADVFDRVDLTKPPDNPLSFSQIIEEYTSQLNSSSETMYEEILGCFFRDIISKTGFNKENVRFLLKNFLYHFQYAMDFQGMAFSNNSTFQNYKVKYDEIDKCKSAAELISVTRDIIGMLVENKKRVISPIMYSILKYIKNNYNKQDMTLGNTACLFKLNASYLSRMFKEQTGKNFVDFVILIRLKAARELLEKTGKSVREISEECGFSNSQYFSMVFRKHSGMAPLEYRHASIYVKGEDVL